MQYILYALTRRDTFRHVGTAVNNTDSRKDLTLGHCIKPTHSLTMPSDAGNAVFNGDYNDYGSIFYFVQANDRTEGIDQYPHV